LIDQGGATVRIQAFSYYRNYYYLDLLRAVITTPPIIIFTKRININKYIIYLKEISIPKNSNEKYMIIPTAGVMLKNKKYFITFVMAFDIFTSSPIVC
jgi:hypothetical protein